MQCENRGSTQEINEYMFVRRIVEGCAASYGVECRVTKAGEATNFEATPAACALAVEACAEVFGRDHVTCLETAGGSEDCSILARRAIEHGAEATFLFYGCNHHGYYRADFEIQDTQSLAAALAVLSGTSAATQRPLIRISDHGRIRLRAAPVPRREASRTSFMQEPAALSYWQGGRHSPGSAAVQKIRGNSMCNGA